MDIESLFENAVDKNFDKFEVYVLKNIFCIPKGLDIVLPHYQVITGVGFNLTKNRIFRIVFFRVLTRNLI